MKRTKTTALALAAGLVLAVPALAADRAVSGGVEAIGTPVFPLHSGARIETDIGAPDGFGIAVSAYLPVMNWAGVNVGRTRGTAISWEDRETFSKRQGWTRARLDVKDRGGALYLDVDGRAQFDYAEVVFGNGRSQIVDFRNNRPKSGLYELLDFRDGRYVDHVTLVARAVTRRATVTLKMERAVAWNGPGRDDGYWNGGNHRNRNGDRNGHGDRNDGRYDNDNRRGDGGSWNRGGPDDRHDVDSNNGSSRRMKDGSSYGKKSIGG